jgi:hypothetical protein
MPISFRRLKEDIKSMDKTGEAILALKQVTFRYKKEFDPKGIREFGLVAEEVEKINPDLVKRDRDGNSEPYAMTLRKRCYSMSSSKNIARYKSRRTRLQS